MRERIPAECAEQLDRQRGVLARWQAPACGLDAQLIDVLLRSGRWQTLYRGVYAAFTGVPRRDSVLWAAVRRCGQSAILSHYSAAELDGLLDQPGVAVHVTIASGSRVAVSRSEYEGRLPPIVTHRLARIDAVRHPARLPPRTRIEETALDLAQTAVSLHAAIAWLSRACGRRLTTSAQLHAAMAARRKMRWRAELASALGDIGAGVHSVLEYRYVRQIERPHGLPAAIRQAKVVSGSRASYLDNLYAEFDLAVELDGQAAHPAELRWQDLRRGNALAGAGLVTLHYTWTDVTARPCQTAREIATALMARGWPGPMSRCHRCHGGRP